MIKICSHCSKDFEGPEWSLGEFCDLCEGNEPCAGTEHGKPCKHNNPAVVYNSDAEESYCMPCREELNKDGEDLSELESWALWWKEEANWKGDPK